MSFSTIIERTLIFLVIVGLLIGLYFFIVNVKKSTTDTKVQSDVRQMGKIMELYKIESTGTGYVDGSCAPNANSCLALNSSLAMVSGAPTSGTLLGDLAKDILNSENNRQDSIYLKSDATGWTVSAAMPSSLAKNGTETYCFSSEAVLRLCTNYPATETNSLCPNTGSFQGQAFTCQDSNN